MSNYDAMVVSISGVGSAALDQLATRGRRVLGLDAKLTGVEPARVVRELLA